VYGQNVSLCAQATAQQAKCQYETKPLHSGGKKYAVIKLLKEKDVRV
jgi:hypothetical protein